MAITIDGTGTITGATTLASTVASPTFTTPALGTPASGILTSCTGVPFDGFKNRIINGGFQVAQRGTSFTSATTFPNSDDTYNLDRWYVLSDGNDIVDITQTTTVPTNAAKNSIGLDVETVNTKFGIAQIIENVNCVDAIGGAVTLSFQAKVSATTQLDNVKCAIVAWSGTADTVTSDIISAWGVEGTNPTLIANATYENSPANLNVTTSFATYNVTATVDTASTTNIILFIWSDVTTTTLGDFLFITNVQLEKGSTASSFDYRSIGTELALCQRYFAKMGQGSASFAAFGAGMYNGTAGTNLFVKYPTTMRASPTLSYGGNIQVTSATTGNNITAINATYMGLDSCLWQPSGMSGTTGYGATLMGNNDNTCFVAFSAEL